jgi:hypothetical protein
MPDSTAKPLELFRAGRHTAIDGTTHEITRAQLVELAESYDPSVAEAPIVVGHPALNAPAYGWARRVYVEGDRLLAEPHQVDPAFAELVNAGRFKKISASIYLADSPANPKPGRPYLRHIGFLGAQPPAVKGLRDASFGESLEGVVEFGDGRWWVFRQVGDVFRRVRDYFVEKEGAERADQLMPNWMIDSISDASREPESVASYAEPAKAGATAETAMSEKTAAEREAELASRTTEIETREQQLAARETQARRADFASFAEGLARDGRILPRHQGPLVELLLSLPATGELSFAEGDATVKKPAVDVLKGFLAELPQQIDFSEKSAAKPTPGVADFAAPADAAGVDPVGLQIHSKALAYQRQHPNTSYLDAVEAVQRS